MFSNRTKLDFTSKLCSVLSEVELLSPHIREYLTGFHKRKVQRRKVALAEIRKKIKDEQIKVREEVNGK